MQSTSLQQRAVMGMVGQERAQEVRQRRFINSADLEG